VVARVEWYRQEIAGFQAVDFLVYGYIARKSEAGLLFQGFSSNRDFAAERLLKCRSLISPGPQVGIPQADACTWGDRARRWEQAGYKLENV